MHIFHVTQTKNIPTIIENGLEPRIGPRAKLINASEAAIYCFSDATALDDAMLNWLGDLFNESQPLTLLEIIIPSDFNIRTKQVSFEVQVYDIIPSEYITILTQIEKGLFH